ncbi:conjugal transfer protein TraD [Afifella sp. H1R]|nr:conjugal transfer protein TraD [Afifella sp. H1R]MCF1505991.1 conjugal transfer protein TraD [Afifella sp. H1R]
MRRPRDIDAELKALQEKAKSLKARQRTQLGELVIATGADQLDMETLAGLLLGAVEHKDSDKREGWRRRGAEFFQRRNRRKENGAGDTASRADGDTGGAAPLGGGSEAS